MRAEAAAVFHIDSCTADDFLEETHDIQMAYIPYCTVLSEFNPKLHFGTSFLQGPFPVPLNLPLGSAVKSG